MNVSPKVTQMNAAANPAQIRVTPRSPAYWRVTIDNPPINVMGPEMVKQFQEVINALEADEQVRVVVFDSAVDDYFLNHWDFTAKIEDLTSLPEGTMGLPPDVEPGAGWDACIASLGRPAAQNGIKALMERGFHKPGDVENRLGYYLRQSTR
jgi:enoyl-CoA hydratase/carnithine racemase